jgi:hypothetical protein
LGLREGVGVSAMTASFLEKRFQEGGSWTGFGGTGAPNLRRGASPSGPE